MRAVAGPEPLWDERGPYAVFTWRGCCTWELLVDAALHWPVSLSFSPRLAAVAFCACALVLDRSLVWVSRDSYSIELERMISFVAMAFTWFIVFGFTL